MKHFRIKLMAALLCAMLAFAPVASLVEGNFNPSISQTAQAAKKAKKKAKKKAFKAKVSVKAKKKNGLHYGDTATLKATVKKNNGKYSIRWEVNVPKKGWKKVATGKEFSFKLDEENADLEYRAVAVGKKYKGEVASAAFRLGRILIR